ncbi:hypothetical protein DSO57_1009140 [Entomophthora muscae]|uniref:Uncharacterized protein n=1 Tax=Entomophthora muscae TaxID=34485 RepID=A0ACC2TV30_9FUNG|nr:hypothetical protein DSO57_1009140 [Entomophthora muscae]
MNSLSFINLLLASVFGSSLKEYCASNNQVKAQYVSVEVAFNTTLGPPDCQNGNCLPNSFFFDCAQEVFFKYTPKEDVPVDAKLLQDAMDTSSSKRGYNGIDFQAHQGNADKFHDYIQYRSLKQHMLTIPYFLYHAHQGDLDEAAEINVYHRIVVLFNQDDLASIKQTASTINEKIFLVAEKSQSCQGCCRIPCSQKSLC